MSVAILNSSNTYGGLFVSFTNPQTHTLYDGVNRMVVVWVATRAGDESTITAIDIDGVAMTNACQLQRGVLSAQLWYMLEEDLPWAENTLTVTYTGTTSRFGTAIMSLSGIKQTAPYDTGTRWNPLARYTYASYKAPLHGFVAQCNVQNNVGLSQYVGASFTNENVDTDCHDNMHIGGALHLDSPDRSGSDYNWTVDWQSDALSTICAGASWEASDYESVTRNPLCVQLGAG